MYSPKIDEDLVKRLYKLKESKKIPLTEIVNEAVREYLLRHEVEASDQKKAE